jgi:hypothetical protein
MAPSVSTPSILEIKFTTSSVATFPSELGANGQPPSPLTLVSKELTPQSSVMAAAAILLQQKKDPKKSRSNQKKIT